MKWGTERNTWSTVLAVSAVEAGMVSEEPPRYSKHPITVMKGPSESGKLKGSVCVEKQSQCQLA